jgi:hypothetical protein
MVILLLYRLPGREIEYDQTEEDDDDGEIDENIQYAYFSFAANRPKTLTWEFFVGLDEYYEQESHLASSIDDSNVPFQSGTMNTFDFLRRNLFLCSFLLWLVILTI